MVSFFMSHKGPYIKDVRTEGERGVGPKADIARELLGFTTVDQSKMWTRGEGGQKNPKILRTSFMYGP